jgi:hypothetical protein
MWPSLVGGGRCPTTSPIGHAGRCSHLWSSSAAGQPDLCTTPGASTFNGVDTVDDLSALPYSLPPQQVDLTFVLPLSPPPPTSWSPWMSSRNQQPLAHSFHTMKMVSLMVTDRVTDSDASNHTTFSAANLTSVRLPLPTDPSSIVVGNRSSLWVTSVGNTARSVLH